MEGIYNILASEGIEIEEDVRKRLNKKIAAEYKSIAEFSDLKKKLEDSMNRLSEYSNISQDMEKLKSENENISKMYQESKINEYKFHTLKSGVNEKFVDFVTSEVMKGLNDDISFTDALDSYNKQNPQYINFSSTGIKLSTSSSMQNQTEANLNTNDYVNNLIRGKL